MIKEIKINSIAKGFPDDSPPDLAAVISALKQSDEQYCLIVEVVENKFFDEYKSRIKRMQLLLDALTIRESEVFRLAIQGLSNKEISNLLFISLETVKSHRKKIVGKAGVRKVEDIRNYFVSNLSYGVGVGSAAGLPSPNSAIASDTPPASSAPISALSFPTSLK